MEQQLREFGLNDNEIRVYKACLELGSSSVTKISERANIYRTLTYEVLNSLSEKGLVSYVVKDKKKYFEAASPRKFIHILDERKKKINEILPDLINIQKSVKTKPSITLYEGKEGVKTALENILQEAKSFYAFSPNKAMFNILKYYFPNFFERRAKAGIKVKAIVDQPPYTTKLLEHKIIKKNVKVGYWIYNNKVIFFDCSKENPIAVVIENKEIAKTMKLTFDILWDSL